MTTRLTAKYHVIARRVGDNLEDLLRNRERGDALQVAAIAIMSVLIAGIVVAAITAAINSRVAQIK